ncbi:Major facilitator superfamily domain general substrate transporter [Penicillium odoratum]|uniref:Major facilitator superfamily domain general substrate transporter n=1 Tax=Penicillium odoratum TaxID=1167516 RepID=UPI002547572F|nr:Major facilitator superfamily domain general substrate transporter [Penicillium odoratum]KAJ5771931.1 Major facilitator superfamily domain general substrate transporter [Penicillium odoratum]
MLGNSKQGSPPWGLKWRSSTIFIMFTVSMSTFTEFFLYAMIVPVLPSALVTRAGIPFEQREYWVSILLMCEACASVICCPIFGYLIDIAGTRRFPYLCGLFLLAASMILLAFARDISMFIIARLLQGGATAMVAVAGLALATDSFDKEALGTAVGYLGSASALGFVLGPLIGGLTYDNLGYQAVFIIASVLVVIDFALRIILIEKRTSRYWIEADVESPENIRSIAANHTDSSSTEGGLPVQKLIRQPRILITLWALLVVGIVFSAFDTTLPIFVESTYHWSPVGAGLIFLPSAFASLLGPYFGSLCNYYGPRAMAFTGFILLCPTLTCLSLVAHNSWPHIAALIFLLGLTGLFINLGLPALYVESQAVLDEMELRKPGIFGPKGAIAQAFGLQTMAQFIGLFFGPLWGGFIEYHYGWKTMAWTLGLLVFITAIPVLWLSGKSHDEVHGPEADPLLGNGHEE